MPFIKLYPLEEAAQIGAEDFGHGQPARCKAVARFDTREIYLNLQHIAAFEECPLYLSCAAETDAVVNGIRIRLVDGTSFVCPDDPEDDEMGFLAALEQAARGEITEVPFSRYLRELQAKKLI
jgi:hypothetical protein